VGPCSVEHGSASADKFLENGKNYSHKIARKMSTAVTSTTSLLLSKKNLTPTRTPAITMAVTTAHVTAMITCFRFTRDFLTPAPEFPSASAYITGIQNFLV